MHCYLFIDSGLLKQALLSAIIKRVRGYIKLRMALGALHAALPDATSEELRAYDDECAICRVCLPFLPFFFTSHKTLKKFNELRKLQEPMAKAKKLHCSHLFHLACLRSWYGHRFFYSPRFLTLCLVVYIIENL